MHDSYQKVLAEPERWLSDLQRRWLQKRGTLARIAYTLLYTINRITIRVLFRFSVVGRERLPESGVFILAPNHASPIDPPVLAAGLPLNLLQRTYWAGKRSTVLRNRLRRVFSWLTRVVPINDDARALAAAVTALEQGSCLVWFPEGRRSLDGSLQEFQPGIAHLLTRCDVPVFPVFLRGVYSAFPSGAKLPRLRTEVVVQIGQALSAEQLGLTETSANIDRAAATLRKHVLQLCNDQVPAATAHEEIPPPRYPELIGVIAIGAAHVIAELTLDLRFSRVFNATALVACLGYLMWRVLGTENQLRSWGMRTDNSWGALRAHLLFFGPAAVVLCIVGSFRGNLSVPATFWFVCALYPFFGVAQQFVLQNLLAHNLRGLIRQDVPTAFAAALLFGFSHLPRTTLASLAFTGGFFFTLIYRRHPNIWVVGIMHGLLAALVFYMVLGEDSGAKLLNALFGER